MDDPCCYCAADDPSLVAALCEAAECYLVKCVFFWSKIVVILRMMKLVILRVMIWRRVMIWWVMWLVMRMGILITSIRKWMTLVVIVLRMALHWWRPFVRRRSVT